MAKENSQNNLAATDAALAQKKQEPMGEIPDWVPGDIPDDKKKEFAEAARKCYESDNTQFDFNGRVYKITEKLVGNQDKLDVNNNGKIDADDLAALRSGKKQANESHFKNEVETPGQTEYPGSGMEDENDNEEIDGEDKAKLSEGEEEKYYSKQDNPMSRERRAYDATKSYRSKSTRGGHSPTSALTSIANQASSTAQTKAAHTKAAALHSLAATGHGVESPQRKVHQDAAKKHSDIAAGLKEETDNSTDTLTIDVPAMIRALEKAREDFKTDEDIHNFVQALLKKKDSTIDTDALPKNESVTEAVDYHAAAMSASAHAKKQPSATTHKAAASAHDKAITWHEKKVNSLIKKDGSADEVKKHEDHIKMHKNEAQKHRFNAHRLGKSQKNESVAVAEKLDPKADAGVWISDFVNSKDPRFDGKSKEERKQQALAAWYAARREAGIKESTDMNNQTLNENIAGDPRAAELTTAANHASALANSNAATSATGLKQHDAATRAHQQAADHYRIYAHHAGDPVLRNVAGIHQKFHSDMAQHHTLRGVNFSMDEAAVNEAAGGQNFGPRMLTRSASSTAEYLSTHANRVKTPEAHLAAHHAHLAAHHAHNAAADMSTSDDDSAHYSGGASYHSDQADMHKKSAGIKESTVNEGTPDESKAGPEVMDPKTKKMKDDANKNVKAEEAPYTNKADGSENIVPADKPVAKPSAMPKLTQKEALRTVADAYTEMLKTAKK